MSNSLINCIIWSFLANDKTVKRASMLGVCLNKSPTALSAACASNLTFLRYFSFSSLVKALYSCNWKSLFFISLLIDWYFFNNGFYWIIREGTTRQHKWPWTNNVEENPILKIAETQYVGQSWPAT